MKRSLAALGIFICLFLNGILPSHAQFNDLRFPQLPAEADKYKKNKIKMEVRYQVVEGSEVPYETRTFDKEGRVTGVISKSSKRIYYYDNKGRVISAIDSSKGQRPPKQIFEFIYDSTGYLSYVNSPVGRSSLGYNPSRFQLEEHHLNVLDENLIRLYQFDVKNRLIEETFYSAIGEVEKYHRLYYNEQGRIASEIYSSYNIDHSYDTARYIYTYNAKGQLITRNNERIHTVIAFEDDSRTVTTSRQVIQYAYDTLGNLSKETSSGTLPEYNYSRARQYDVNQMLHKELVYDGDGNLLAGYIYKYTGY
ncbi:MAG: hypothetical protein M3Q97_02955 [Bacteroidota bacterium]|nr:hypothetical protein [Bacteroidota bacterium]